MFVFVFPFNYSEDGAIELKPLPAAKIGIFQSFWKFK